MALIFPNRGPSPPVRSAAPRGPRPTGKARWGPFALFLGGLSPSKEEVAFQGPTLGAFLPRMDWTSGAPVTCSHRGLQARTVTPSGDSQTPPLPRRRGCGYSLQCERARIDRPGSPSAPRDRRGPEEVTLWPVWTLIRTDLDQPRTKALCFRWEVDFNARRITGETVLLLEGPSAGPMDLDTKALEIGSVTAGGRPIPYELGEPDPILGQRLRLNLPPATQQVTIAYATTPQATALQWLVPEQTAGKAHPFMFSQCQPHHARTLAPFQDSPRVRVSYTAEVTVPEDLTAVMSAGSSGVRVGPGPRSRTFLFHMPQPIPSYLIALAVGDLACRI